MCEQQQNDPVHIYIYTHIRLCPTTICELHNPSVPCSTSVLHVAKQWAFSYVTHPNHPNHPTHPSHVFKLDSNETHQSKRNVVSQSFELGNQYV